jgi:hypothetical protein
MTAGTASPLEGSGGSNDHGRFMALVGLREAVQAAEDEHGYRQVVVGQGAFWACALDEQLRLTEQATYTSARDGDLDGLTIHGLRLARNAIAHGVHLLTVEGGLEFPLTFPEEMPGPHWMPLDRLLERWTPRSTRFLPREVKAYGDRIAGQLPGVPLRAAHDFFTRLEEAGWDASDPAFAVRSS